jgi:hypothetical protein
VERPVPLPAATDLPKAESGIAKGGPNDGESELSGTQTRSFDLSPTGKGDSSSSGKEGELLPSSEDRLLSYRLLWRDILKVNNVALLINSWS